jgi:hypothetical protein
MAVPILFLLIGTAKLSAQEPDTIRPARFYHSFHGMFSQREQGVFDIIGAYGQAVRYGPQATWLMRLEARGGISFWGTTSDAGTMLGLHPGIVWSWVNLGDYIDFGGTVDLSLMADGGAYFAWNMAETPGEKSIVPTVSGGAGLRFRGARKLGTLELMYEDWIGVWKPRLFLRVGVYSPR